MVSGLFNRGKSLLEQTFVVGASVTTYLDSANRAGICPFRMVILDASFVTTSYGTNARASVKYPNTSHANGEKLVGVAMGPENTGINLGYAATPGAYYPIGQGKSLDVRMEGIAPVIVDATGAGTPILPGDFVAASVTSNNDGFARKGTLTNNAPAAGQHILGLALNKVAMNNGVVLTHLRMQES